MRRGYKKNLYEVLILRTFFQSQAALLLLEYGESLRDWKRISESAGVFLNWFFPTTLIGWQTGAVAPRALDRVGIDFQLDHGRGRMAFRNIMHIFDVDQE